MTMTAFPSASFQMLQLRLEQTLDTQLLFYDWTRFALLPSGTVGIWSEMNGVPHSLAFHFYTPLWGERTTRPGLCRHLYGREYTYTPMLLALERDALAVSCRECQMIRVLDVESGEHTVTFHNSNCFPAYMCQGEGSQMFATQSTKIPDAPLLQLDSSDSNFVVERLIKSTARGIHSMCFVPSRNFLVFTQPESRCIKAISCESGQVV